MKCNIPIYVETRKDPDHSGMGYSCAPLFSGEPACFDVSLPRAMSKLAKRFKPILDKMGESPRHDELLGAIFHPEFDTKIIKLRLDLTSRVERMRLLFVVFSRFGRRIAFSPSLPEVWFEIAAAEDLETRAAEVLTSHFRRDLKDARRDNRSIHLPSLRGQGWVATLEMDVALRQSLDAGQQNPFAALWDNEKVNGAAELHRVGRCLDWLYPDGLKGAVLREREVQALRSAMRQDSFQPVAIIGPRLCGKTSVLHEAVRRVVARRRSPYGGSYGHWMISPQRLISGMSFVGQWESRLLAIVKEANRKGHVLCFDNFLGLYEAGKSSCSQLSVADVLRNHVLRRQVRIVGEMTGEQWSAFQERDRGLADQFHVIRIEPTNDEDTLRILVHERRRLEQEFKCRFQLDAIPSIWEIHRRYDRGAAFPGKAAGFMRRLASKSRCGDIGAEEVYRAFNASTGLSLGLLDGQRRLSRRAVVEELQHRVIGQAAGVSAAADAIMLSKAGVNDPSKPISTMLFLGPTGVGKTQCAKSLAETMFSDDSRLIRFDMNEYGTYAAATRLVGTRRDPDGLLTAAVRRQPYAVILLDEIEKAHPDVFDLLLQVLGEGRLTDSRGRTADFSNTVIVMTSNLGVRSSGRRIGWNGQGTDDSHIYTKAARRFFRPEFFNRIDRIVPFQALSQNEMAKIAELTVSDLLNREGLVARRTALRIDREAMDFLVSRGYHPRLGARALKRTVEACLAQPVARRLSKLTREVPTLLAVNRSQGGLETNVYPLVPVAATSPWPRTEESESTTLGAEVAEKLDAFCARIRSELEFLRPQGAVSAEQLQPEQLRYYAMQEQLQATREALEDLRNTLSQRSSSVRLPPKPPQPTRTRGWNNDMSALERTKGELHSAYEIAEFHDDLSALNKRSSQSFTWQQQLDNLVLTAAWLNATIESQSQPERVVALLRPLTESSKDTMRLLEASFSFTFHSMFGYDYETLNTSEVAATSEFPFPGTAISISGVGLWPLIEVETGTHLVERENGRLSPISLEVIPVEAKSDLAAIAEWEANRKRAEWLARQGGATAEAVGDPFVPPPVVRHYLQDKCVIDYRVGRERQWGERLLQRHAWIWEALPLPKELADYSPIKSSRKA